MLNTAFLLALLVIRHPDVCEQYNVAESQLLLRSPAHAPALEIPLRRWPN
ncbi:hypothetical protein AURDEDRAFT_166242 [Auricularia subglabra TFB-10046 SS5]|nr:hypothetical protein AURDEDRAFT_166242 [Auricularia subglabra TFB-10046 SS5]